MSNFVSHFRILILSVPVLFLAACGGGQHADLQAYVEQVKARQKGSIPKLPEVKPYESFAYGASEMRDPFLPFAQEAIAEPVSNGLTPDITRKREALEQFALDSLVFVGHLEKDKARYGLIAAPDATVYRVQVGNHLGQNYGEILEIQENKIILNEIVSDGAGGWIERKASLSLNAE